MQYSTLSLRGIRQKKDTKVIKLGKEEVKLCLFANSTVLYLKEPVHPIRKLLDLINGLQDTKSMQKSQQLLYITTANSEFYLIHNSKRNFLGINLTKAVNDRCSKDFKTLKKESEEDTDDGKTFHISVMARLTKRK